MHEFLINKLKPHNKELDRVEVPHAYIRCLTHNTISKMRYPTAVRHERGVFNCVECRREAGREDANKRYQNDN